VDKSVVFVVYPQVLFSIRGKKQPTGASFPSPKSFLCSRGFFSENQTVPNQKCAINKKIGDFFQNKKPCHIDRTPAIHQTDGQL
jgi:hypothetical protein